MASTPRYVGTDAATARAFLCAALGWSDEDFLRVFDLDGDGAVAGTDEAAFVRSICMAETEVDEALSATHGTPFTEDRITDSIREVSALRVPWCAVRGRALTEAAKSSLGGLYTASDARLKRLREDNGARIPTVAAPEPTASALAGVVAAPATPWADTARGTRWTGF